MSEHTPGPWTLETNGPCWNLRSPDRVDHFLVLLGMTHNNPGELEANACLIAAAPELLGACKRARRALNYDIGQSRRDALDCLNAAIAQAEGGER